jgi:hypothetical protein
MITVFLFLFGVIPQNAIAGPYNSYIYPVDSTRGVNPSVIRLNNNVIVTVYSGSGGDGYIRTMGVSSNGSVNSIIDTWIFDIGIVKDAKISFRNNLIVIAYLNSSNELFIRTFRIYSSGNIAKTFLDTYHVSNYVRIDDLICLNYENQFTLTATKGGNGGNLNGRNGFHVININDNGIIVSVYLDWAHKKISGQTDNISSMCSSYIGSNYELILVATLFRYTALLSNISLVVFNVSDSQVTHKYYYNKSSVISSSGVTYNNTELIKTSIGEFSNKFVFAYSHFDITVYISIITFEVLNNGIIGTDFYIYHYSSTQTISGLLKINETSTAIEIALFSGSTNNLYLYRINISKETNLVLTGVPVKAYYIGISLFYSVATFSHTGVIIAIICRTTNSIALSMFNFPNYDFTQEEQPEEIPTENTFYIKLIDGTTGAPISGAVNYCFVGPLIEGTYAVGIESDLWTGYYCSRAGIFTNPFKLEIDFIEGSYHWLNISCFKTYGVTFINYSQKILFTSGTLHTVILYTYGYGEYSNGNTITMWNDPEAIFGIRTDKTTYIYPEQIRIQYMFPTIETLQKHGKGLNSFKIGARDSGILTLWEEKSSRQKTYLPPFSYDLQWHNLTPFVPFHTVDGYDKFSVAIVEEVAWWLPGVVYTYAYVYINIYEDGTGYVPHGNFTSIVPAEPVIGEYTHIYFNANNNGTVVITHVNTGQITDRVDFDKPVGNGFITRIFNRNGQYLATLYVYTGIVRTSVDTLIFYVNGTGENYEDWGYGTEYLMVEENKLIAGYDWLNIMYKTLKNNTVITIDSPRNSRAPFSTVINNITGRNYRIFLPSWCAIGEWNVTMLATETLYDTFHIVAEENNYCEFISNSYVIGNPVDLYIRHTKRVKVIFLYDDISYGEKIYFDETNLPEGYFGVRDTSFFTPGLWTVQLWETNDRTERKLISEDSAYFNYGKTIVSGHGGIVFSLQAPFTYIAGTILTLICLIIPALLIKSTNTQSEILKYVPLFSGIFGFILSCLIGFFPWYAIFGLILTLVVVLAVIYQSKKG